MPPASKPRGLLLDIGGVVHATGIHLVGRLAEAEPAMRRIETWNAASNRYMIAVNEELGYEVWGQPYRSAELPVASVRQS